MRENYLGKKCRVCRYSKLTRLHLSFAAGSGIGSARIVYKYTIFK